MNILFLTTGTFHSIDEKSIYPDLLREFRKNGHEVYIVSTNEDSEDVTVIAWKKPGYPCTERIALPHPLCVVQFHSV